MSRNPPPPLPPIPAGWELLHDPVGRAYYHNSHSGQTQWEPPADPVTAHSPLKLMTNGVDFDRGIVLDRSTLVKKVTEGLQNFQFLVVGAPPAYGKTSLLQLLEREYQKKDYWVKRFGLIAGGGAGFDNLESLFEYHTGIDLNQEVIVDRAPNIPKFILCDEAHTVYDCPRFWQQLFKQFPTWNGNANYKFVFAVTYDLKVGGSPVAFREPGVQRIGASELLLTKDEEKSLIDIFLQRAELGRWIPFRQLWNCISSDSGGQVGVIITSMINLRNKQQLAKEELGETELLQVLFGNSYLDSLGRCFEVPTVENREVLNTLSDMFVNGTSTVRFAQTDSDERRTILRSLVRGGVLRGQEDGPFSGTYSFSTPLTKRLYYTYLFPGRVSEEQRPTSVVNLVLAAIRTFSAKLLRDAEKSSTSSLPFPKETAFQHLFAQGLAQNLPASCAVCPEMSRSWDGENIAGEVDFFVNGDLKFGIELLIKGDSVGEHLSRFGPGGKYSGLKSKQYIVVDFRLMINDEPTNVRRKEDLLTIFFSRDYTRCRYFQNQDKGEFFLQA